jgi:hypothetical protein
VKGSLESIVIGGGLEGEATGILLATSSTTARHATHPSKGASAARGEGETWATPTAATSHATTHATAHAAEHVEDCHVLAMASSTKY